MSFDRIKDRLENLCGFRRYAAAFALGALMAAAMPPLGLFPVLLLCVPGLAVLARATPSLLKSCAAGWAFGAGYFIAGLYWVSAALFVDIAQWWWVMPFSLVAGPALFGLWYGLVPLAGWKLRGHAAAYALVTVAAWAGVEWLRGHLFTGLPWNLAGYAWMWAPPVMQAASVAGIYGLTLLTLLWAATPLVWKTRRLSYILPASFIAVSLLGMARLVAHPLEPTEFSVRIIQPNTPQDAKWDPERNWDNIARYTRMSSDSTPVNFVIWPETAIASDMDLFPEIAQYITLRLPRRAFGIYGAQRTVTDDGGGRAYYNSIVITDNQSSVVAVYDKHHLVPFGEYIPFRGKMNTLPPLAAAIAGTGDFTAGPGPRTIAIRDMPTFSPLICYEAIFPGEAVGSSTRPDWMVNVTNDGWYGRSAGPFQHFEAARMRTIEQGLPLARAANTGISAIVDPLGRVPARLGLGEEGVLNVYLPKPLPPTVYARYGDSVFFAMLVLLAGWGLALARTRE